MSVLAAVGIGVELAAAAPAKPAVVSPAVPAAVGTGGPIHTFSASS